MLKQRYFVNNDPDVELIPTPGHTLQVQAIIHSVQEELVIWKHSKITKEQVFQICLNLSKTRRIKL